MGHRILSGEGKPLVMWGWENNLHRPPPELREREYNPERSRQLLAEAGYLDGFEITLTPDIRNIPGEIEACEAIGTMWGDIGVKAKINRVPWFTISPVIIARDYQGANCHRTGGRADPINLLNIVLPSTGGFTVGFDHPILDDPLSRAVGTVDTEERFKIVGEIGRFVYE